MVISEFRGWRSLCWLALVLALALATLPAAAQSSSSGPFDYSPWDRVLKRFVTDTGRVDYAALKADPADLDRFVEQIAARSPITDPQAFPTRDSQLAYWINAYNALVMKGVIDAWPVKSVRDIGTLPYSFFWRKKFVVGGRKYTLNHIEGEFLRKQLAEPRIHFALVCAANSCPRLQREAYMPENTERLLEEAARFFNNEPRHISIDAANSRVTVARIYTFYRKDFVDYARRKGTESTGQPLLDYIKLYLNAANRAALDGLKKPRVDNFDYDWGINDINAPVATGKFASKEEKP